VQGSVKRRFVVLLVAALASSLVAGVAGGSTTVQRYRLSAKLTRQAFPPFGRATTPRATFTATLVGRRLTWKLTYAHLSSKFKAAHIHLGAPDTIGPALVAICFPPGRCDCPPQCNLVRGDVTVSRPAAKAIGTRRTYIDIHTAKHPRGEIRGQIVAVAVG